MSIAWASPWQVFERPAPAAGPDETPPTGQAAARADGEQDALGRLRAEALRQAIVRTVAELPAPSRRLLAAMAVLDREAPLPILAAVADVSDPAAALNDLIEAGFVSGLPHGPAESVRIEPQALRDVVYWNLPTELRREIHRAVSDQVGGINGYRHLLLGGRRPDPALAGRLEDEATCCRAAGDSERAGTLLLWSADLSVNRRERERRLLTAAWWGGEHLEAEWAQALSERLTPLEPSVERNLFLGRRAASEGRYGTARLLLGQAGLLAHDRPAGVRAAVHLATAALAAQTGDLAGEERVALAVLAVPGIPAPCGEWSVYFAADAYGRMRGSADAALRRLEALAPGCEYVPGLDGSVPERPDAAPDAVPDSASDVVPFAAPDAAVLDPAPDAAALDPAPDPVSDPVSDSGSRPADHRGHGILCWARGAWLGLSGRPAEAVVELQRVLRSHDGPVEPVLPVVYADLGYASFQLGDWRAARYAAEEGIQAAEERGDRRSAIPAAALAAGISALKGEWTTASEWLDFVTMTQWAPGPPHYAVFPALAAAMLAQARDKPGAMLTALAPLAAEPDLFALYQLWWRPLHTEALIDTGRLDAARSALDALRAALPPSLPESAVAVRLGARLAAAEGDRTTAAELLVRAIERPAGAVSPFTLARLEHDHGRLLLAVRRRNAAIRWLISAQSRYADIGAWPFADRCRRQLTAIGVQLPGVAGGNGGRGGGDGGDGDETGARTRTGDQGTRTSVPVPAALTPQEHRIACLAADGMTNQQIARTLFVSAKTVEYHLGKTFAKLGITSRHQLRGEIGSLADGPGPPPPLLPAPNRLRDPR